MTTTSTVLLLLLAHNSRMKASNSEKYADAETVSLKHPSDLKCWFLLVTPHSGLGTTVDSQSCVVDSLKRLRVIS